jgi:uncharacterized protein DUF6916
MSDQLTQAVFEPLIGKIFRLQASAEKVLEVALVQADKLPPYAGRGAKALKREPFSLVFRGPKEFVLPQQLYALEQETLGRVEIFLVPIGPDEIGQRYEAVFN